MARTTFTGYCVLTADNQLCFTSDWTGNELWQIYTKKESADAWAEPGLFANAEFKIIKIEFTITED